MSGVKSTSSLERPKENVEQPPALYKESVFHNKTFTVSLPRVVQPTSPLFANLLGTS